MITVPMNTGNFTFPNYGKSLTVLGLTNLSSTLVNHAAIWEVGHMI